MALYETYTTSTNNAFLQSLSAFATANGWVIDRDSSHNTNYRRLHLHKGSAHYDLYSDANYVYCYPCTDWNELVDPNLQPGGGFAKFMYQTSMSGYTGYFVSTLGCIYIGFQLGSAVPFWGGLWQVQSTDKIGAWTGGFGAFHSAVYVNGLFTAGYYQTPYNNQMYYDSAWSSVLSPYYGSLMSAHPPAGLIDAMPFVFNLGIMPLPILIMTTSLDDAAKLRPMAFAPGVYRCAGGSIYNIADEIVIGSDTYLIMPYSAVNVETGAVLFKIGN
jgi:hypothetical protein